MPSDFSGGTAQLYARFRRDLPADQAAALATSLALTADDTVVDLGCGTGQLTVPLRQHCAAVLAVDPEPAMLVALRARRVPAVLCVLGDDHDLPALGLCRGGSGSGATAAQGVGAVVVGNALHWTDERSALSAAAGLLRPGGGVAVVTQGPPLWLGTSPWQRAVREVLERGGRTGSQTCGSDEATLGARARTMESLGLEVTVARWRAGHVVDADWVVGHLGSAGALRDDAHDDLADRLRRVLADVDDAPMVEEVSTTAVIGRRPA